MQTNLIFEMITLLYATLASSGIIYLITIHHLNKKNLSFVTKRSEKNIMYLTFLIGFCSRAFLNVKSETNFINFERNEGNIPHNRDLIEINTTEQNRIILEPFEINTNLLVENELNMDQNPDIIPSDINEVFTSLDSMTVLDRVTHDRLVDIVMELHNLPMNTPEEIIRQLKLEELNILYSQDIIQYGVTQTDLRLLIESIPVMDLFQSDINH